MEVSSIITQVSREEDQITSFAQEKVVVKTISSGSTTSTNSNASSTTKKPKQGFLRSLFCCWKRRSRSSCAYGASSSSTVAAAAQQGYNGTGGTGTGSSVATSGPQGTAGGQADGPGPEENGRCSPVNAAGPTKYLLPVALPQDAKRCCMVIDLDETLVHSSFKPISNADFVVPVEIDGTVHQVYVQKRPYVDEFLRKVGELYECVLFTASLAKYADPVADLLDKWGVFRARLFRESCVFHRGNYVKDLGRLGRDLQRVIIIDNSPASYIFHPDNAVPVASWFDDMSDTELLDLIPFFERLSQVDNVYTVLRNSNHPHATVMARRDSLVTSNQNHVQTVDTSLVVMNVA